MNQSFNIQWRRHYAVAPLDGGSDALVRVNKRTLYICSSPSPHPSPSTLTHNCTPHPSPRPSPSTLTHNCTPHPSPRPSPSTLTHNCTPHPSPRPSPSTLGGAYSSCLVCVRACASVCLSSMRLPVRGGALLVAFMRLCLPVAFLSLTSWRRLPLVVVGLVALVVSACGGGGGSGASPAPPVVVLMPSVLMPAEQFVRVDSFELAAQALVGQVTYSASGLDADSQLTFALGGSLAEAFAISSDGDIMAVAAVSRADFPVLLLVSAALGGEVAARTRLLIERRPDLVPTPAPSIELPAVQHLVAADVGVGAVVGRLQFVVQPTGLQPVLTLSGEGAEYFVVDSAGMVSVAGLDSAGMALATTLASAESFNFRLILSAVLPLTDTVAQSTITISSVPVVPTVRPPPPPPPPPPPVVPRPNSVVPLPADARVFMPDQVVEIDSGLAYSEATAPGTCVVRFALARVEDDPCWALVPVAGTAGGQGYTVVYEVLDAGVDNFVMSGNTLLLKSRQRLVGLGAPTATVGLVSNVRVRGRFAGSVQTSEIVIRLTPVLPTIEYNGTTFTDVPITDTLIDIGKLGFSIVGGAPDRRLQYFLEGNSANLPLSIRPRWHPALRRLAGSLGGRPSLRGGRGGGY